jgi:hypothetical protein
MTDPTDGNPFDVSGETLISIIADGNEIYSFTKTGGGYADNFMNFHVSGVAGFDNLVIAQLIPEPSRMLLLGTGSLVLLVRRRK